MAGALVSVTSFLKLFYTTSKFQQRVLLDSATDLQVKALSEIILNVLDGFGSSFSQVQKRRRVLRKFFRKGSTVARRRHLIQSHPVIVLETLLLARKQVLARL